MTRLRLIIAAAVTVLLLAAAAAYAAAAFSNYERRQSAPSQAKTTVVVDATAPRLVFRNTALGAGYGLVASVPLSDPGGARSLSKEPCDRVFATAKYSVCLRIDTGVVTTFSAHLLDASGKTLRTWPLPGIPSRARISDDSRLVAFTSFITGVSYASVGFATATQISSTDGHDFGNLEDFALTVDGSRNTAADRNFWGVTFTADDNVFYATAASGGHTWLVRGDLAQRTLTAIRETAECPSVSPDGTRVAYKKNVSPAGIAHWAIAVLDLATGSETILPEKQSVDDQVEWLDDSTLLYGMPRDGQAGDSDVRSIASDGSAAPHVLIEHAWSPSVVRR